MTNVILYSHSTLPFGSPNGCDLSASICAAVAINPCGVSITNALLGYGSTAMLHICDTQQSSPPNNTVLQKTSSTFCLHSDNAPSSKKNRENPLNPWNSVAINSSLARFLLVLNWLKWRAVDLSPVPVLV